MKKGIGKQFQIFVIPSYSNVKNCLILNFRIKTKTFGKQVLIIDEREIAVKNKNNSLNRLLNIVNKQLHVYEGEICWLKIPSAVKIFS